MLRYYEDPSPTKLVAARLDDYAGTYELAPGVIITVSREGGQLYAKRTERPRERLIPEVPDLFFRAGVEGRRLFRRGANGKIDALIERRNNQDVIWRKL